MARPGRSPPIGHVGGRAATATGEVSLMNARPELCRLRQQGTVDRCVAASVPGRCQPPSDLRGLRAAWAGGSSPARLVAALMIRARRRSDTRAPRQSMCAVGLASARSAAYRRILLSPTSHSRRAPGNARDLPAAPGCSHIGTGARTPSTRTPVAWTGKSSLMTAYAGEAQPSADCQRPPGCLRHTEAAAVVKGWFARRCQCTASERHSAKWPGGHGNQDGDKYLLSGDGGVAVVTVRCIACANI